MSMLTSYIRRLTLLSIVFVLVLAFPLQVLANSDNPPSIGTTQPTGADAATYTFNSDTGLWENDYYTWNPVTKDTLPKFRQTYTYNASTGQYDTTTYLYSPAAGKYEALTLSVNQPPAGAEVIGSLPALAAVPQSSDSSGGQIETRASGVSSASSSSGGSATIDTAAGVTVNNALTSKANSGDALVLANTTAGGAGSGNALNMATVLNVLQSSTSLQGGSYTTFTKDVGDWQGDLVIDPSALSSAQTISINGLPSNLTINARSSGQINNDIYLDAGSGNATIAYNTAAGSAATGDADSIANIVNIINSIIGAGQSFVGIINIKGNLDGDILLPPGTLNSLLTSNSAPTVTVTGGSENTLNATLTVNSSIINNLDLSAVSGTATVSENTTAGDATTGKATTNLTLLNLTGKQVIGSNALLVFVNVLGNWVGMIVNAPGGSTAAALGGGITDNSLPSGAANLNYASNSSITNNVRLNSTSGNALVSNNTTAGNATSGNASASLNLLNISNSNLSLSSWFGILFINVFGSWRGSFGIDTAAGGGGAGPTPNNAAQDVKVFKFIPSGSSNAYRISPVTFSAPSPATSAASASGDDDKTGQPVVLASTTDSPGGPKGSTPFWWVLGGLLASLTAIGAAEQLKARRTIPSGPHKYQIVPPLKNRSIF